MHTLRPSSLLLLLVAAAVLVVALVLLLLSQPAPEQGRATPRASRASPGGEGLTGSAGDQTASTQVMAPGASGEGQAQESAPPEPRYPGVIAGTVVGPDGPLAGAEISVDVDPFREVPALDGKRGEFLLSRQAATAGNGTFEVRNLPEAVPCCIACTLEGYMVVEGSLPHQVVPTVRDLRIAMVRSSGLTGRVTDGSGQPVAGAKVTLASGGGSSWGMRGQESGEDGAFAFEQLPAGKYELHAWHQSGLATLGLELGQGEVRSGLEVVLGDVGLAIAGTVVDRRGAPVEGVRISIEAEEHPARHHLIGGIQTRSDASGAFRVGGLEPGTYSVTTEDDWSGPPSLGHLTHGTEVRCRAGTLDLRLEVDRGVTVRGVVLDPEGRPAAGATIRYTVISPGSPGLHASSSSRAAADGSFELSALRVGRLELAAWHREHAASEPAVYELESGAALEGIALRLQPGLSVTGTVVDPAGLPLRGADVAALIDPEQVQWYWGRHWSGARTDEAGAFRISQLRPGMQVTLVAQLPGYFQASDGSPVIVTAGETGIRIILQPAGTISGRVTSASGEPIHGVRVVASATGQRSPGGGEALTNQEGRYEITGLGPGTCKVSCEARQGLAPPPVQVTLGPGQRLEGVDLVLESSVTISGLVVTLEGEPIQGVGVSSTLEAGIGGRTFGRAVYDRTDATGRFELTGLTTQQPSYELLFHLDGFGPAPGESLLREAPPGAELTVRLRALGRVVGEVTPAGGELTTFRVRLLSNRVPPGILAEASFSFPDGRFELPLRYPTGPSATVAVLADGYQPVVQRSSRFDCFGTTDLGRLELRPGGVLLVEVLTPDGAPVLDAGVTVEPRGPAEAQTLRQLRVQDEPHVTAAGRPGCYRAACLPPGSYLVTARHPNSGQAQQEVTLPEGWQPTPVRLTLRGQ